MLNPEMWAKIGKMAISVGAVVGIQVEPEQLELIAQGAAAVGRMRYADVEFDAEIY